MEKLDRSSASASSISAVLSSLTTRGLVLCDDDNRMVPHDVLPSLCMKDMSTKPTGNTKRTPSVSPTEVLL